MARKSKLWTGISRRGHKWRVNIRVAPGPRGMRTKTFDLDTSREKMQAWRAEQKGKHGAVVPEAGTLAGDVHDYLQVRQQRPSYRNTCNDLQAWVAVLGGARSRHTVRTLELTRQVDRWKDARVGVPTIRSRIASLRAFFNNLDAGLDYKNPVRDLRNVPPAPKPRALGQPYTIILPLVDSMPDYSTRGTLSKSKLRARVIGNTGVPPGMLIDIEPTDLDLVRGTMTLPTRWKGDGVEGRTLLLSPQALAAWRAFDQGNAYGYFNDSGLLACLKRAAKRIGVSPTIITTYVLRHSFLTQLYRVTRDLATVGRFADHVPGSRATFRYALAANEEVDRDAIAAFSQSLPVGQEPVSVAEKLPADRGIKLPGKATSRRKLLRMRGLAAAS